MQASCFSGLPLSNLCINSPFKVPHSVLWYQTQSRVWPHPSGDPRKATPYECRHPLTCIAQMATEESRSLLARQAVRRLT